MVKSNGTKRINCSKCEIKHNVASYFEKLENASQSLIENVSNYTNCLSKVDLVNVDLKNVKINQKSKISNINKIDLDSKLFVNTNTSIKCDYCKNVYKSIDSLPYKTHLRMYHSDKLNVVQNTDENTNDILNFLDDEEDLFDPNIEDELATCSFNEHIHETYFDAIKQFATKTKFKFMHLNINSLHSKIDEIDKILKLKKFDIVFINETKFDKHKPIGFYKSSHYDIIRRDRDFNDDLIGNKGGGIIIFVKKHYKVKFIKAPDMEFIYMNVMVNNN